MGKVASKLTKRIMAALLSTAMILSNMTVYASELSGPSQQTEEAVENTETNTAELPSTEDETASEETAQDDGTQDGTAQDGTTSGEGSKEASDGTEDGSVSEEADENIAEAEDVLESEDELASEDELEAEASEDVDTPAPQADGQHTVWLVGDSTVCAFTDPYYYPRYGYGTQIENYLDDTYTVQNLALSGRSSKSFTSEANYKTLTDGIQSGDVLVIGFGHNDEKAEPERYTNPNGDYQTEGSFAKSLYDNYVKMAQDKGAEVIICTPIVRRNTGSTLTPANCHITTDAVADGVTYPGGDYPQAIRDLGAAVNVSVVDLTALTKALYEELGPDETVFLHAWLSGVGGDDDPGDPNSVDNTHLNIYGAKKVAWMFATEVQKLGTDKLALAGHIDLSAGEPTKADLVKNPSYVKPDYTSPTEDSTIFWDYIIEREDGDDVHFKGTAFGDIGGNPSPDNHTLTTDADGNMRIKVASNKGKIASGSDGIAMYYYRVPVGKTFKLSAKATLTYIDDNSQVAFGLMARDDMYIDKNDNTIKSDYVVAGTMGGTNACNSFYRQGGALGGRAKLTTETVAAGNQYELSIVYNGDGYECTFGNEPTQSGGYDFQLTSVDTEYVYIGMFGARNVDVTYSNIYLEIDGQPIADTRKIEYTVTMSSDGNGTASADKKTAAPGETVTLTASPAPGYVFKNWEVLSGDVTISNNKFTMPKSNVSIKANFTEILAGSRLIDVWDFGGKTEDDTDTYINYITPDTYNAGSIIDNSNGAFLGTSPTSFGDLTMYYNAGDRLYTNTSGLPNYGSFGAAQTTYADGYSSAGAWYCNGTGGASRRYVTISNVQAGDKIVAYMGIFQTSDSHFCFEGQGDASAQKEYVDAKINEFQRYEFVAQYSGTYKIYEADNAGKPMYHRIMRVPGVFVSGEIDFDGNELPAGYSVVFVNQTTKGESVAQVADDDTFTVTLAPGYEYKAIITGAVGFGFTNESAKVTTTDAEALTGKTGVNLVVEPKSTYLFSGTIKGFASDYDVSKLVATMTPPAGSDASEVKLNITNSDGNLTFRADLEPYVEYSIVLEGVNDYRVLSPLVVNKEDEGTSYENRTILVALKPMYDVVGGFIGLDKDAEVTELTFTNLSDSYVYKAAVANGGYSISLRDGDYLAKATVTDYNTTTHVVVDGGDISKDLLFVSTAAKEKIAYAEDIYVGYPNKANNYATVSEAMEACELMDRTGTADQRITVHIAPGTYREQIIVNAPNVSLVNDSDEEVLLTWYYGIGYKYYSTASSKYYNAADAYDKFDKNVADRWGVAVYVKSTATAFRAEGITFENSFNRYVTDEEIKDGVEVSGTENIKVNRNYSTDVTSKEATERAAAIGVEADKAEFLNCGFYSSQDTLYTQGAHIYFKNCVIEGQTDYIFGSGNCVFDACELSWKGYSTGSTSGYVTANRPSAGEAGYLFRNCAITANNYNKLSVSGGYFGRPWGADAKVVFLNTKLYSAGAIVTAGWTDMSGATAANANFREYNTTALDGTTVDTSGRVSKTVMSDTDAAAINVSDYFGTWTPVYYTEESDTVEIDGNVTVIDNADINTPKPGNTLTVKYSLKGNEDNDASIIEWYTVEKEADGTEKAGSAKLVKSSTAAVDKTYKVGTETVGKYIKVTVTPQTVSGKAGTAKSYTLENAIVEGYEDPSNQGSISRGDGVNIFLAGDSTVKDYSASGMYNSGKALNEGSWGEYIQSFFNESEVTIQNYAQGGRSSRTFISEGKLDDIIKNIEEGDYLFIQFGHNDSSDDYADRYVPLGEPDADGVYPVTPGTPDSNGVYPDNGTGTFKWFLKQYIDAAKDKKAIPVLVTPVARMYYNDNGTIYAHHAVKADSGKGKTDNTYITAMEQLAQEENVLLIDGYALTEKLFTDAWTADGNNNDTYGTQIMASGDKTHNNKLGGIIEAAAMASTIQAMDLDISYAVKSPSMVGGMTTDEKEVFNVDPNGTLTAYDINSNYTNRATYWENVGQTMFNAIKAKAAELGTKGPEGSLNAPIADPSSGIIEKGEKVTLTVEVNGGVAVEIYYTTDGTSPKTAGTLYTEPIEITADTTIRAYAKEKVSAGAEPSLADSKVVTYEYTLAPSVKAPTAPEHPSGSVLIVGTKVKLESETPDAEIRYTMGSNPADPTVYSPIYNDETGIAVTKATTIKAIAIKDGETSEVSVFTYTVTEEAYTGTVAAPEFLNKDENVSIGTVVKLSAEDGAVIYYTMGDEPADPTIENADIYDEDGIVINRSTTIKAVAIKSGVSSTVASHTYNVPTVPEPKADVKEGEVSKGTKVTLTCDDSAAVIYFTLDGSDPRNSDTREEFKQAISIEDSSTTIKAYATKAGLADSKVVTFKYTLPVTDAPVADPPSGTVDRDTRVTLTSEGAVIYYTLDGTDPKTSENRIQYEWEIYIRESTTIKAYAVKEGFADSKVVTYTYTVLRAAPPTASPEPGEVAKGTKVYLSCEEDPTRITYTLNGTDPKDFTTGGKLGYKGPIVINNDTTIKAYVESSQYADSEVVTFVYTVKTGGSGGTGSGGDDSLEMKFKDAAEDGSYTGTYTGSAITPAVIVTYNGAELIEGIDYTVKYTNNTKVSQGAAANKKPKVTVTGKGNLSGSTYLNFEIDPKSLDINDNTGLGAVQGEDIYVALGAKAVPVLSYGGVNLTTKDYDYDTPADKNKTWTADGEIVIKGKGNFDSNTRRTLAVHVITDKKQLQNAKITVTLDSKANKNLTYTGEDVYPVFKVTTKSGLSSEATGENQLIELKEGEEGVDADYIVTYPEDIRTAGKKTFTVIGISSRCVGTVTKTYTIKPAAKTGEIEVQYDGTVINEEYQPILPFKSTGAVVEQDKLTVTYVDDSDEENPVEVPMTYGTDYKITYSGNKKPNNENAKFTITGLGNFKGVKTTEKFTTGDAQLNSDTIQVIVPNKLSTKPTVFKSTPYVYEILEIFDDGSENRVLLKSSNYKVTYWEDEYGDEGEDENGRPNKPLSKLVEDQSEVWVKIEGKGVYRDCDPVWVSYEIVDGEEAVDFSKATIKLLNNEDKSKFYYNGGPVKPDKIKITYKDIERNKVEDELILGDDGEYDSGDYEITVVNNISKGKATVIIKSNGSAVGGKTATFNISAQKIN